MAGKVSKLTPHFTPPSTNPALISEMPHLDIHKSITDSLEGNMTSLINLICDEYLQSMETEFGTAMERAAGSTHASILPTKQPWRTSVDISVH